jgi:hypothetical protein
MSLLRIIRLMTTTAATSNAQQSFRSQPAQDQPEQVQPRPGTQARPYRSTSEGDLRTFISIKVPLEGAFRLTGRISNALSEATDQVLCLFEKILTVPRFINHTIPIQHLYT